MIVCCAGLVVMVPVAVPSVLVLLGAHHNAAGQCPGAHDAPEWHCDSGEATTHLPCFFRTLHVSSCRSDLRYFATSY